MGTTKERNGKDLTEAEEIKTGKGQFSFQFQRRAGPKNVQTTIQLHSLDMLATLCSKPFKLGFSIYLNWELPDAQAEFSKGRGARESNSQHSLDHGESKEIPEKTFASASKAFDCVDHNTLWKILKDRGIPDHLTCLLRNLYAGQETRVRTGMEWLSGSKLGKGYGKAVYYHPAYLTSMQSTSCEMPDWSPLTGKDPDAVKGWRQKEMGAARDEMVR